MNFKEFINSYLGKKVEYDNVSFYQCVDFVKLYCDKCFNIVIPRGSGNAENYWNGFEKIKVLNDNFVKIKNTPSFIPEEGDIMVWNTKRGNGAGHVAVCSGEGNTKEFYSYDQNWNGLKYVQKVKHNYSNVYGVLRKKNRTGNTLKIKAKFTGAIQGNLKLVEFNKKQFWINSNETLEEKGNFYLLANICFEKENSVGVAFHCNSNEFQMEILKNEI